MKNRSALGSSGGGVNKPERKLRVLPLGSQFDIYFDVEEFSKWMFGSERWSGDVFTFKYDHPILNAEKLAIQNPAYVSIIRDSVPKFLSAISKIEPKKSI